MELDIDKRQGLETATSVAGEVWTIDQAKEKGFNLSHRSVLAVGRNEEEKIIGIVPVVLTGEEISGFDNFRDLNSRDLFRQRFLSEVKEKAKSVFGIEETINSQDED